MLQLIATGAQDAYLTSNPQITFFRTTCHRYSNFSMESIQQQMIGNTMPGRRATCSLSRNGDLVSSIMVEITVPELTQSEDGTHVKWVDNLGLHIMEQVSIEVGGQRIDTQTSDFMNIYHQLTCPDSKELGFDAMVRGPTANFATTNAKKTIPQFKMFVPLRFWFNNKNYANALPLLALQYHEVKISIDFADLNKLVVVAKANGDVARTEGGSACHPDSSVYEVRTQCFDAELYVDYIYLDTAERKKMATQHHEYLIEQCQFTGVESIQSGCSQTRFRLNFNHPVKALLWIAQPQGDADPNNYADIFDECKLLMNGHDRFSQRSGDYFTLYQPYQHWPRVPHNTSCKTDGSVQTIPIYTYSFALSPASHVASGTANFSRIDAAQLELICDKDEMAADTNYDVKIYAINYNVIRIMGGLGGLAYSS